MTRLKEKLTKVKEAMGKLAVYGSTCWLRLTNKSLTDPDSRSWRRAATVPASSATTCRSRSIRTIT